MCPNNGLVLRPPLPYQDWLDLAVCVHCVIFQHCETLEYLCCSCLVLDVSIIDRSSYRVIIRHYVNIGDDSEFEQCSECGVEQVRVYPLESCLICIDALREFTVYLQETGDDPYNSPEPTRLSIIQYVGYLNN